MKTLAQLTTADFKKMLQEFYPVANRTSQMTELEVRDLAQRLNEKINVPVINETGEEKILIKIVLKIDTFLYENLPNEFYDLIRSSDNGLDDKEAKRLVRRLTKLANDKIDIPYLPEIAERIALKFIIGIIIDAARKNLEFENIQDKWSKKEISSSIDDIDDLDD